MASGACCPTIRSRGRPDPKMQWLVARLRPEAAFGSLPKGDMLFGQLCWAIRHRFGEARLETLLEGYTDGQPFLVISDAFPAGFLPRPELPLPGDTPPDQRKARKRGRYLASRLFAAPLPAQPAKDEIAESPFEAHPQPHNSISRLTGTTGNGSDPYQMQRWWWRHHGLDAGGNGPALEIHCLLDTARLSPHDLGTLLEDMGAFGFGRDASIGLGRFALERLDATEPPGAASGERLLALAPSAHAPGTLIKEATSYRPFVRFGRHGAEAGQDEKPFKSPVLLMETGAVLAPVAPADDSLFLGRGLGGDGRMSHAIPGTVHQGYAPVVRLALRGAA